MTLARRCLIRLTCSSLESSVFFSFSGAFMKQEGDESEMLESELRREWRLAIRAM